MAEHLILGAFVGCLAGGFLPWINSEAVVTGAALLLTADQLAALAIAGAVGQMIAKAGVYSVARWTPERLPRRVRAALGRAERLRRSRSGTVLMVLASSTVSLPPFYVVTLAAGLFRIPFVMFMGAGLAGTLLRYGIIIGVATALANGGLF